MNITDAMIRLSTLLQASSTIVAAAQRVSTTIQQAQAEGRDLTDAELDALARDDALAANTLDMAIKTARGG